MKNTICIGGYEHRIVNLELPMANRHGLISGATGTGKTVTLQVLAEGFSRAGVPVFMADVKGDLSGVAYASIADHKIKSRLETIGISDYHSQASPVLFWDVFARNGHPVRTTISEVGPLMLSNLLSLNSVQSGILYSVFEIADDNGLLLLDLKDLRSMLNWVGENAKQLRTEYGNLSTSSIGAIQSRIIVMQGQGGENLFGEPALQLQDLLHTDFSGHGVINILHATELMEKSPRLYAAFLLWLLSELFETLPEVGDADKPKLVLFFDEAHLLFDDAPAELLGKIEQVVRLIRSKGVGVYFVSQSPLDLPQAVLGQLGMRIQHALRAFTPGDLKVVRAVAQTFRANPKFDTQSVISELGVGEALVSVLNRDGSPTQVERIYIRPPESRIGPLNAEERVVIQNRSPLKGRYENVVDRESAYEELKHRADASVIKKNTSPSSRSVSSKRQGMGEALLKSAARSIGNQLGRRLVRGLLGSLLGKL